MAFLMLGIGYLLNSNGSPHEGLIQAGGAFGILAAFIVSPSHLQPRSLPISPLTMQQAWYNALAGIADSSNSFFLIPVAHFPWSEKGREKRQKVDNSEARAAESV